MGLLGKRNDGSRTTAIHEGGCWRRMQASPRFLLDLLRGGHADEWLILRCLPIWVTKGGFTAVNSRAMPRQRPVVWGMGAGGAL